jgi:ubiquinone/menaquinone biosynthesis C-methylase UbiE
MSKQDKYIPAMGYFSLARLYDPLIGLFMREKKFKNQLIQNANISTSDAVLDMGCGTGTLLLMVRQAFPQARLVGLDGDGKILAIAHQKIAHAGVDISLDEAMSFDMPYPDGSFDRVLTSLMLHHLSAEEKRRTLKEVFRVLVPGGELHIADFAMPHGQLGHLTSHFQQSSEHIAANIRGLLPDMMAEAGFVRVLQHGRLSTLFGTIGFFSGARSI